MFANLASKVTWVNKGLVRFLMNAKEQLYENKNPSFQASKTVKKIYGRMWLFIINPFSLACVEESIPVYPAFCYVS
jgi:hypothetical protein